MTELMEYGLGLVGRQKRRLSLRRFTEIKHGSNHRGYPFPIFIRLWAVTAAPCATSFARAGKEIHIQHAQMRTIFILALESESVGVRFRDVLDLGKRDTV